MDCLGRLSEMDVFKAFELGASEVVILVRKDHECKNGQVVERLIDKVESLHQRLEFAGIEKSIVIEEMKT